MKLNSKKTTEQQETIIKDKLLRPKIVTALLGVSKSTLCKMGKAGKLMPIKISARCVGYRQSDIEKFIKSNQQ